MPTSSIRFEKWGAASVRDWHLRMIIGKTTMGEETMREMTALGCVHVSPQSVSPNSWIGSIEATWYMTLDDLGPFVVDIDCSGKNLYAMHEEEVDRNRADALEKLGIEQDFQYTKLY